MIKKNAFQSLIELLQSKTTFLIVGLIVFTLLLTSVLSLKYYLFQNMINEDNTSKKDIIASKTIKVVDTYKTELQKKAASQSINPVLMLAEGYYISNDMQILISNIEKIRDSKAPIFEKKNEISKLFSMLSTSQKKTLSNFFIDSNNHAVDLVFERITQELDDLIKEIKSSDKELDQKNVTTIILNYAETEKFPRNEIPIYTDFMEQVIIPNIVIDEQATKIARKNAEDSIIPYEKTFQKGDKIIYKGQLINKFERAILKEAGYNILDLNFESFFGIFVLVCFSVIIFLFYLNFREKQYYTTNYLLITGILSLLLVGCAAIRSEDYSYFIIPLPLFTMLIGILASPKMAVVATLELLAVLSVTYMMPIEVVSIFVLLTFFISTAISKNKHSKRADLLKIGVFSAIISSILILCVFVIEKGFSEIDSSILLKDILSTCGINVISGFLANGMLPLFEAAFKIVTPFSLAELGDTNQPLLRKLQSDAPGTYAHSIAVANLAENAAEAIQADPVLARVGALYHDIGKLKRPLFFIENQPFFSIENPHNKINPKLSKMIVTAHTKDGVEIAKDKGLPQAVQDMILQHHGQSLASYFYHEAIKQEGAENVKEEQFRYNGQKPTTKEAAILMIADGVEAAARTLKENYTQEELQNLINRIIKDKLDDGQLSDSPLTLKDLKVIAQVFERILRAAHHQRIKYHADIMEELKYKVSEKSENAN